MTGVLTPARFEEASRKAFNKSQGTNAQKKRVEVGGKWHEYDLYEPGIIAGGVSTSPWQNKTGTNNTGGQDRVAAEILWLHLCTSVERKVLVLRDRGMAEGIKSRFGEVGFFRPRIEVHLYDEANDATSHYADL